MSGLSLHCYSWAAGFPLVANVNNRSVMTDFRECFSYVVDLLLSVTLSTLLRVETELSPLRIQRATTPTTKRQ